MNETLELSSSVKLTYLEISKEEKSEKKFWTKNSEKNKTN